MRINPQATKRQMIVHVGERVRVSQDSICRKIAHEGKEHRGPGTGDVFE